jgi:hypothetical protein
MLLVHLMRPRMVINSYKTRKVAMRRKILVELGVMVSVEREQFRSCFGAAEMDYEQFHIHGYFDIPLLHNDTSPQT